MFEVNNGMFGIFIGNNNGVDICVYVWSIVFRC